jgi:hypothetical protein
MKSRENTSKKRMAGARATVWVAVEGGLYQVIVGTPAEEQALTCEELLTDTATLPVVVGYWSTHNM